MSDLATEYEARAATARANLEKHARDARVNVIVAAGRIETARARVTVSGSSWVDVERIAADLVTSARMARECAERVEHAEREAAYARREAAQESKR